MADEFLSPEDLAKRYGRPLKTIYRWNYQRSGPPFLRMGRAVRYRLADVKAWEKAHEVGVAGRTA